MTPPTLSPTDVRIVAAALANTTQEAAARAAGVSLRTYQRRIASDAVRDALSLAAASQLRDVTVRLSVYAANAVDVLGGMTNGTLVAESSRVKAAAAILTLALKVREIDAAERLAELIDVQRDGRTLPRALGGLA